ncbi:(2Fe-2S)-binding protein [Effusibacillus pohliae]|uniref:(2Fe-2S)-binding protein n=1 Tax=Effusibacillus pohliae TaxID=232270 RepID=UPI00036ABC4C|nr:(2Fe-2S)-binding protein [Effusibacillus pohliae]
MFDGNLGRLIDRIAGEFGLSLAIMWGNVGNYVGYLNEQYQGASRTTPELKQHLEALHTSRGFEAPPLRSTYQTVRLHALTPPESVRVRSTCCLWYQFPGNRPCLTCPRLDSQERARLWIKHRRNPPAKNKGTRLPHCYRV